MRPFKTLPGALFRALGHYPTHLRGAALRVDPNHWRFWRKAARGLWEPQTLEVLARRLEPHMVVCDIGAWIGPTTILAARQPTLLLSTHAPYLAPTAREPMMRRLADALRAYGSCLDERGEPVRVDALVEPTALNRFRTFLFTN